METHQGRLKSTWFDGRRPKGQAVWLEMDGPDLRITGEDGREWRVESRQIHWAERTRHGQRQTYLPDGSTIIHAQGAEWDRWRVASGHVDSGVVRMMQSWRGAMLAMVGTVAFLLAAWQWGVPVASKAMARWVPASVEETIGRYALNQLDILFLDDTKLSTERQQALTDRFAQVVNRAYVGEQKPPSWHLGFYESEALGANAFALPGGQIVVTDALVEMLDDQPDAVMGVLAHELGHVEHRHGLDLMFRSSMLSALVGLVVGDASTFLTTIPLTLTTQGYSRDAEREADAHAAQMLHDAGISPAVMASFFERIQHERHRGRGSKADAADDGPDDSAAKSGADDEGAQTEGDGGGLSIAISSHPGDQERIRFFRDWRPEQVTQ